MKTTVSFRDFIKNGRLNEIEIGVSQTLVEKELGAPDDVADFSKSSIAKYRSVQFGFEKFFERRSLHFIGWYVDGDALKLVPPRKLELVGWPDGDATPESLRRLCRESGVSTSIYPPATFDEQSTLTTETGVSFVFARNENSFRLRSIQLRRELFEIELATAFMNFLDGKLGPNGYVGFFDKIRKRADYRRFLVNGVGLRRRFADANDGREIDDDALVAFFDEGLTLKKRDQDAEARRVEEKRAKRFVYNVLRATAANGDSSLCCDGLKKWLAKRATLYH